MGTLVVAGRIHGVRRWGVRWDVDQPVLLGFGNFEWEAGGKPTTARCLAGSYGRAAPLETRRPRHHAPSPRPGCECGLYAHHPTLSGLHGIPPGWAALAGFLPSSVIGIVEAWGRVELHRSGFRAQHARLHTLAVHQAYVGSDQGRLIAEVAQAYEASVVIADNLGDLVAHCARQDLGVSADTVRELLGTEAEPSSKPLHPRPAYHYDLPEDLTICETCQEVRGRVIDDTPSGRMVRMSTCFCEGLVCDACGRRRLRRPISDYYDPARAQWWHVPHFAGFDRLCADCKQERSG